MHRDCVCFPKKSLTFLNSYNIILQWLWSYIFYRTYFEILSFREIVLRRVIKTLKILDTVSIVTLINRVSFMNKRSIL